MRTVIPDDLWDGDPTREMAGDDAAPVNGRDSRPVSLGSGAVAPQYPAAPARRPRDAKAKAPQADSALSTDQKAALAMVAKRAYEIHEGLGTHDGLSMGDWRHREIGVATGGVVHGLREASQRWFVTIRRHFLTLAGEGGAAFPDAMRDQPERADWELAWNKLEGCCRQWGVAWPAYPAAIARDQFRCELPACTRNQLWAIFYTVTNRGREKAKEAASATAQKGDSGHE